MARRGVLCVFAVQAFWGSNPSPSANYSAAQAVGISPPRTDFHEQRVASFLYDFSDRVCVRAEDGALQYKTQLLLRDGVSCVGLMKGT